MLAFFRVEADGVRTEDVGAFCARVFVEIVTTETEVILVDRSRKRAVAVVLPRATATLIVRDDDDVEISWRHVENILSAQIADAFEVAPPGV